jgi:hypothetical protein
VAKVADVATPDGQALVVQVLTRQAFIVDAIPLALPITMVVDNADKLADAATPVGEAVVIPAHTNPDCIVDAIN